MKVTQNHKSDTTATLVRPSANSSSWARLSRSQDAAVVTMSHADTVRDRAIRLWIAKWSYLLFKIGWTGHVCPPGAGGAGHRTGEAGEWCRLRPRHWETKGPTAGQHPLPWFGPVGEGVPSISSHFTVTGS